MTLANKLTVLRIILTPAVVAGLLSGAHVWPAVLFFLSAVTDVLDGAAARRRGEKTLLGSYLDPMADKLLLVSVYMTLTYLGRVPMWAFIIIFSRDLFILLGWSTIYILTHDVTPAPRLLGKLSTFTQLAAAGAFLAAPGSPLLPYFLWPMIAVTSASAVDYISVGVKRLSAIG
jgi:cardiolipin synthase (CMP-forming)